jgi:hypothetical protein
MRIKANLPTVRIDEITLHHRDNAMLLATHGRAIWVLDHLEPIQEYAAAQAATAEDRLFTPPPVTMYRRPSRDRNYEFWGDQTFFGENPPQAALFSWHLKRKVGEVKLRVTDAAGREVRELSGQVLANSSQPGIQSACWDLRVQPVPAPAGAPPGGGRGGAQAQAGGESGRAANPFGAGCGGGGGGFAGGGFGGGTVNAGPFVLAGTYNVSLIVDGKTVDTKPFRVMSDPEVALTELERKRLFDMAMEMHELQRRGIEVANTLRTLSTRVTELAKEMGSRSDVADDLKTSFEAFNKDLGKFAPTFATAGGGAGGRGGGGGAGGPGGGGPGGAGGSVLARLGQAKGGLMGGIWPTEQTMRAYNEAKTQVPKAIAEANALFAKAAALSSALATHNLTLPAPQPVR